MKPDSSRTPGERATPQTIAARLETVAEMLSKVMEEVRLDACKSRDMNHLWTMDMLHDARQEIYSQRILVLNTTTSKP